MSDQNNTTPTTNTAETPEQARKRQQKEIQERRNTVNNAVDHYNTENKLLAVQDKFFSHKRNIAVAQKEEMEALIAMNQIQNNIEASQRKAAEQQKAINDELNAAKDKAAADALAKQEAAYDQVGVPAVEDSALDETSIDDPQPELAEA